MPKEVNKIEDIEHPASHHHAEEAIKLIFRGLIPIVFVVGGLVLLALRIKGWSLFIGIPMLVFGSVFLIYTYDEVVTKKFGGIPIGLTNCSVCGKSTPIIPGLPPQDTVCPVCKGDIKRGIKKD